MHLSSRYAVDNVYFEDLEEENSWNTLEYDAVQ